MTITNIHPASSDRARTSTREPTESVAVRLLGGFEVAVDGERVDLCTMSSRLVAFLALRRRPTARQLVAGSLWPDCGEARSMANLRTARWKLAGLVCGMVETKGNSIALRDGIRIDVSDFEVVGRDLLDRPEDLPSPAFDESLLDELLPGWFDDWVLLERERLNRRHRRFAESAIRELARRGRSTDALDLAIRLVNSDPFEESGQRLLVALYCAENNRVSAVRHLAAYARLLSDELGYTSTLSIEECLETFCSPIPRTYGAVVSRF